MTASSIPAPRTSPDVAALGPSLQCLTYAGDLAKAFHELFPTISADVANGWFCHALVYGLDGAFNEAKQGRDRGLATLVRLAYQTGCRDIQSGRVPNGDNNEDWKEVALPGILDAYAASLKAAIQP